MSKRFLTASVVLLALFLYGGLSLILVRNQAQSKANDPSVPLELQAGTQAREAEALRGQQERAAAAEATQQQIAQAEKERVAKQAERQAAADAAFWRQKEDHDTQEATTWAKENSPHGTSSDDAPDNVADNAPPGRDSGELFGAKADAQWREFDRQNMRELDREMIENERRMNHDLDVIAHHH